VAAVSPLKGPRTSIQVRRIATLVDAGLNLRAGVERDTVRLRWRSSSSAGTSVFYRLARTRGRRDVLCEFRPGAADECLSSTVPLEAVRRTTAADRPGPGTWTYRIGVSANYRDDPELGDVFLVSRPVTVTVR
jgi:hypothetical protein